MPGIFSGNTIQNISKAVGVFTFHKLNNITQVISMVIQMSLRTGQRQTARGIRGKVTQVPSFDKLSESRYARVLFQGAQSDNSQPAFIL